MANRRLDIVSMAASALDNGFVSAALRDTAMTSAAAASAEELAKKYEHLAGVLSTFAVVATSASEAFKKLYSEQKEAAAAFLNEKELMERRYTFMGIALQNEEQFNEMSAASATARANITGVANKAMEDQMLSLVETGRFSTEAFGEIIYQQVKMELAGIAAISAVKALYYGAVGLGLTALSDPRAGAAFASAAGFALISGATYAAAATVQAAFWGQEEYAPPASSTGRSASARSVRGASSLPAVPASPLSAEPQTRPERNITVNIYNPISGKDVREAIVDIINEAGDMNYKINAKIIEAG